MLRARKETSVITEIDSEIEVLTQALCKSQRGRSVALDLLTLLNRGAMGLDGEAKHALVALICQAFKGKAGTVLDLIRAYAGATK